MINNIKSVVNNVTNAIKNNRILMIMCVFIIMGLAVALINYLQSRTIEMFSVYANNYRNDNKHPYPYGFKQNDK
jgi:flagellar biosynthesis/type III secretory pathway M-ring protein FliF/YscJ